MKRFLKVSGLVIVAWVGFIASISFAAPQSIRDVNWKNLSYPVLDTAAVPGEVRWMRPGAKASVSLINGRSVEHCGEDIGSCPSVTFDTVTYGALSGIPSTVAAVALTYHSGGTAHWQYIYVFTLESGKLRRLAWLRTGSRADQGLREVSIANGDLVLVVNDPDKRQGDCCSAGSITIRYRWAGSSFAAIGRPVHKIDPPSFDCTKAVTSVERLICKNAELSFLDNQMAEAYQTVLRNASPERKAIIQRQQAQWLSDYTRACNAPLSEEQRHDCIDGYLSDRLMTIWK
jgi:uncharacterized protein YecT (DUF1311 family)